MQKRNVYYGIGITGLVIAGLLNTSAAQDDLIPSQQTVQAGVDALFTATAQAEAYGALAPTIEAAFRSAQTATAQSVSPLDASAMPENVATLTDAARILTATVALEQTATALFQNVPEWVDEVASELVRVDGGPFEMGTTPQEVALAVNECVNDQGGNCQLAFGEDSAPPHSVTVSAFQIERTEVTYQQYIIFLTALGAGSHLTGCNGQPCIVTRGENENSNLVFDGFNYQVAEVIQNFPVANVTWYGAEAYCRAIGRRLPTEAEWEHAARGFANTIYPWGDQWIPTLAKTSISPDEGIGALPVGSFLAGSSFYGALDMAGNVAEWVSDWYDPAFYQRTPAGALDPTGPEVGTEKVVRGGSWDAKPFFARSVHRQSADPAGGYLWIGFRCAADMTSTSQPTMAGTPAATRSAPDEATASATPT